MRPPLLAAFALGVLASCQIATKADEFKLSSAEEPLGICSACPASSLDLRHPPCRTSSNASDDGEVYTYVWRKMRLGARPDEWKGPGAADYEIGIDLDCSDRPDGKPATCEPRSLSGAIDPIPWEPMPHGIDNAVAQRIFGPLWVKSGGLVDFEAEMSANVDTGGSTIGVTITQWNGTADDPQVDARMFSLTGISAENGGPPTWDGNDLWDVSTAGPDPNFPGMNIPDVMFKTSKAYVANGVLVADLSSRGVSSMVLMHEGARLEVQLHDLVVMASITRQELSPVIGIGRYYFEDLDRSRAEFADFLSGCNPTIRKILDPLMPDLIAGAMDITAGAEATPGQPCAAMSVGYGADAYRAQIGGYQPPSALPSGCPSSTPQ